MTPEQAQTLAPKMAVAVPCPVYKGFGDRRELLGEATVNAVVGYRYHCTQEAANSVFTLGTTFSIAKDKPTVDKYGFFWAGYREFPNSQVRRLLVHISEAELVEAV